MGTAAAACRSLGSPESAGLKYSLPARRFVRMSNITEAKMEINESNRIVAAILAAGLIRDKKEGFSGTNTAPTVFDAIALYGQCLEQLALKQGQPKIPGQMFF